MGILDLVALPFKVVKVVAEEVVEVITGEEE